MLWSLNSDDGQLIVMLYGTGGGEHDPEQLIALGYFNGANIAAAIILLRSEVYTGAVLLRPMLPLQNSSPPTLQGKKISILDGKLDTVIPSESTKRLVTTLKKAGADVTVQKIAGGHELTASGLTLAAQWLSKIYPRNRVVSQEITAGGII
jgi:predicted esterase